MINKKIINCYLKNLNPTDNKNPLNTKIYIDIYNKRKVILWFDLKYTMTKLEIYGHIKNHVI